MDNKITILESMIEQLRLEIGSLKCCGNCFYGKPCEGLMQCMNKHSHASLFAQSHKCGAWDYLPGMEI